MKDGSKNEEYHTCPTCNQRLCITCFNMVHFGVNAPRAGKSMVYNKCIFCDGIYATNARGSVCDKCTIILDWISGMNYLAASKQGFRANKDKQIELKTQK